MPLDDNRNDEQSDALEKIDKVIALLAIEDKWCKFFAETSDRRRCLWGAMWVEDATRILDVPILEAIRQVTGHHHWDIDTFNDHPTTTHATVLEVLHQTRHNIRAAMLSPAPQLLVEAGPLGVERSLRDLLLLASPSPPATLQA